MTETDHNAKGETIYIATSGAGTVSDPYIRTVSVSSAGAQRTRIDRYLDTNGDGSGNDSAIGDYSGAAEVFYIQPPVGQVYRISRMLVFVEDVGSFDSGSCGNGIALTNGIQVRIQDDSGTIADLTAGMPIKTNPHWKRLCYDTEVSAYGIGNESLGARWTFTKAGQYIRLDGDNNERLEVVVNDDFTGLIDHTFLVQGYKE